MNHELIRRRLFRIITITFLGTQSIFSARLISPSNSNINYYGRIDFSDPEAPKYCWSGVIIEAAFTGSTIGMKIDHSNAYYDIEVDSSLDTLIHVISAGEYLFDKNLSDGNHVVKIKLRSEDHVTVASFQGLLIADGDEILDAPPKPARKIEFIGDSYTAGYGVESPGRDCTSDTNKRFTNAHTAFAGNVTKAFHAQSIILGWSGAGMVKNYEATTAKRSSTPFPYYYDRVLEANNEKPWDYTSWIPELVVICLGTNDYTYNRNPSSNPAPDDSMYMGDYHKFITRILNNYPEASILCVSTGDATFENNVKKVVSEQHSVYNNSKVYFAPYPSSMENTGCDWHPNVKDNIEVAAVLVDTIMKKLDWDTTASSVGKIYTRKKIQPTQQGFQILNFQNQVMVKPVNTIPDRQTIHVLSLDGKTILTKSTDTKGICTIPKSTLKCDVFAIGNERIGWKKFINIE